MDVALLAVVRIAILLHALLAQVIVVAMLAREANACDVLLFAMVTDDTLVDDRYRHLVLVTAADC